MITRKYAKDYRLEPRLTKGGRVRDEAIYCGAYFSFTRPKDEVRRSFRRFLAVQTAVLLLTLLPMLFASACSKQVYIILPLVFILLPIYWIFSGLYHVHTAEETVIHEYRDKIANRIPMAAALQMILSAAVLCGNTVFAFLSRFAAAEWIFLACSLLRLGVSIILFLKRNDFSMEPAE